MIRSSISRPVFKTIGTKLPSATARTSFNGSAPSRSFRIHSLTLTNRRPALSISKIAATSQYASKSGPPFDHIDTKNEEKIAKQTLEPHPDDVTGESSRRHLYELKSAAVENQSEANMGGGMRNDLKTIADTFRLNEVPKESYYLGAAGVIPYAITSLSTVYLTYDIGHAHSNLGQGILISPETAYQLLHLIEPIQIGYGAVIISFLGAIHWGLEYAAYGGNHGYRRYMIGVIAPAVAWPTMLMPIETALITQFLAFVFLYFADARATVRGWCPPWYSTYRFVLTFFVGASIVVSLIGRGQIVKVHPTPDGKLHFGGLPSPAQGMQELRDSQWENLEKEEMERRQRQIKADEEGESEAEEEEEESGDGEKKDEGEDEEKDEKQDDGKDEKKDEKKDDKKDDKK